jgi:hypothetical protein
MVAEIARFVKGLEGISAAALILTSRAADEELGRISVRKLPRGRQKERFN